MAEHTPWTYSFGHIYDKKSNIVASIDGEMLAKEGKTDAESLGGDYGKLIVLAVNSHAELLAALKDMQAAFGETDGRIPSDAGSRSIDEQESINKRALKAARLAIDRAGWALRRE